jgi:hypothetical protein
MEYRGKQYRVVQGIDGKWKWSVDFDGHSPSARAPTRPGAVRLAELAMDRLLAPKKKRLVRPVK